MTSVIVPYLALSGVYGCYRGYTLFDSLPHETYTKRIVFTFATGLVYASPITNLRQMFKLGLRLLYKAIHYKYPAILHGPNPYYPFQKIDMYSEWSDYHPNLL